MLPKAFCPQTSYGSLSSIELAQQYNAHTGYGFFAKSSGLSFQSIAILIRIFLILYWIKGSMLQSVRHPSGHQPLVSAHRLLMSLVKSGWLHHVTKQCSYICIFYNFSALILVVEIIPHIPQRRLYLTHTTLLTHWGRVTHICVSDLTTLVQIMACRLVGAKPLSEPMLEYY